MEYIILGVIVWAVVGTGVALLLGRAINLADRRQGEQRPFFDSLAGHEDTLGHTHPGR